MAMLLPVTSHVTRACQDSGVICVVHSRRMHAKTVKQANTAVFKVHRQKVHVLIAILENI
jgi:hypothetical protein